MPLGGSGDEFGSTFTSDTQESEEQASKFALAKHLQPRCVGGSEAAIGDHDEPQEQLRRKRLGGPIAV